MERYLHIGGVVAVGFDPTGEYLLVITTRAGCVLHSHLGAGRPQHRVGVPEDGVGIGIGPDRETLWGPTAAELRKRLGTAATSAKRFAVVEEALLKRQSPLEFERPRRRSRHDRKTFLLLPFCFLILRMLILRAQGIV